MGRPIKDGEEQAVVVGDRVKVSRAKTTRRVRENVTPSIVTEEDQRKERQNESHGDSGVARESVRGVVSGSSQEIRMTRKGTAGVRGPKDRVGDGLQGG